MEKRWLQHYDKGVPEKINPEAYDSLTHLFESSVDNFREKTAYINMGQKLSFNELDRYTYNFAAFLQKKLGLKKGDRIAIMLPNLLQYPIALFGAFRAGLVVVNVNPLYTARELEHQLKDSGAKAIVVLTNFGKTLETVLANTEINHIITTEIGDMLNPIKGSLINFAVKHIKKMVPAFDLPQDIPFKDILKRGAFSNLDDVDLCPNDIAFLQYTGGTTGVSKGAVLTHRNLIANLEQACAWAPLRRGKEYVITALPLYHIFSLTANCLLFLKMGGCNHLITNPRDIPNFIKELSKVNFSAITGVNTLFQALLKHPQFKHLNFKNLTLTLGGGMAVQRVVAEEWKVITGTPLIEAYGLTESSPAVCINPMSLTDYNGCIGLPLSSTEISIIDNDENHLDIGHEGELCVKGPQVMKGYWNKDEETNNTFTKDGWLKTGDMAKVEEDGFVRIVGRKKDMILVSGFNVYPNEIEDIVVSHHGISEAAAIGVPDDKSGEAVKLIIVKHVDSITEDDVLEFCKKNFTGYKVPKQVEFVDELPKSNVGKVLHRKLRTKTETEKKSDFSGTFKENLSINTDQEVSTKPTDTSNINTSET